MLARAAVGSSSVIRARGPRRRSPQRSLIGEELIWGSAPRERCHPARAGARGESSPCSGGQPKGAGAWEALEGEKLSCCWERQGVWPAGLNSSFAAFLLGVVWTLAAPKLLDRLCLCAAAATDTRRAVEHAAHVAALYSRMEVRRTPLPGCRVQSSWLTRHKDRRYSCDGGAQRGSHAGECM